MRAKAADSIGGTGKSESSDILDCPEVLVIMLVLAYASDTARSDDVRRVPPTGIFNVSSTRGPCREA